MRKSPLAVSPYISRAVQATIVGVATLMLLVILWAGWQVIRQPDIGALWTARGEVYYAAGDLALQSGDLILTIDGVPAADSPFPYYLGAEGDVVQFEVLRDGQVQRLSLPFTGTAPPWILLMRLMITVVAFAFWG